jgi:hypothetical protein
MRHLLTRWYAESSLASAFVPIVGPRCLAYGLKQWGMEISDEDMGGGPKALGPLVGSKRYRRKWRGIPQSTLGLKDGWGGLAAWALGPAHSGWETSGRQRYRSYGVRGHGYVGTSAYGSRSWSFRFGNIGRAVRLSEEVVIKAPLVSESQLAVRVSSGPLVILGLVYRVMMLLALVGVLA